MERTEIVIVGGGIVGAACAAELARRGHAPLLLERAGEPGMESSEAAAGMLGAQHDPPHPAHFPLLRWALERWRPLPELLRSEVGADIELGVQPGVRLLMTDEAFARAEPHAAALRETGYSAEVIDATTVRARHPWIETGAAKGALWLGEERHVAAGVAARGLARLAQKRGARVRTNVTVLGIDRHASPRFLLRTGAGDVAADFVVNAGGAWGAELAAHVGLDLPVFPVRGQMMTTPPLPLRYDAVVLGEGAYLLQRPSGHVLVGATVERVGFDKNVVVERVEALWHEAQSLVPSLRGVEVEARWAGLRPGSADGQPILDAPASVPGFILANGHFRNGILLGPATGELVADLVEGKRPPVDLSPYRLARFSR